MSGPNESPAPVAAGREAIFEGAAMQLDPSGFPPDVNPVGEDAGKEVMSLFKSAIHPIPCSTITAMELWDRFRSPQDAEAIGRIRDLTKEMLLLPPGSSEWKEKKEAKDKLKRELSAASVSCRVTSGGRARAAEEGRIDLTGYLQIDLDAKDHPGRSVAELIEIPKHDPHIQHVAISPSGDGVKALCRIGRVETREGVDADRSLPTFKDAFACAQKHFAALGVKIDPSCSDVARLCYVTHDPDAWSRAERAAELPVVKGADALRGKAHSGRSVSSTGGLDARLQKGTATGYGLNDLEAILAAVGPQLRPDGSPGNYPSYDEWLLLVNAAFDGFGAAAIPILEKWRACKPGELEEKFQPKNRLKKVKFNFLLKAALKSGWVSPHAGRHEIEIPSDVFPVPGGEISISMAAEIIFSKIAPTHSLFIRNTTVIELVVNDGQKEMSFVGADRVCSLLEGFGKQVSRLRVTEEDGKKKHEWFPTTFSQAAATKLLVTNEARRLLPPLRQILSCPVLAPGGILNGGYHAHGGGTFVHESGTVPELSLPLALSLFDVLLAGFHFASPSDRSRAAAHLISLALKMGGWISDDYPLFVVEADHSQAGKSYFLKLVAALYNEIANPVVFARGGVGSADEAFSTALITGRVLVTFENVRGKLDSPLAESAIRGLGRIRCRTLRKSTEVDASAFLFQLSTNGAELTVDLANRALITCIRKHPPGHCYTKYPEGDLIAKVTSMQPVFLGAVFAIIREWQRLGCQLTAESRHDFRGVCQALDWIVQNILKLPPLLDGHREKQQRVSDDRLVWLRNVVMEIEHEGEMGQEFNASGLAEFAENHGFPVPPPNGKSDAKQRLGILMAGLFRKAGGDFLQVDGYTVRRTAETRMDSSSRAREHKTYRITKDDPST
jgi:hypothetical protein